MTFFDSSLGKIHYRSMGVGDKYLLLLHGNVYSSNVFKYHLPELSKRFRVFIPDLPGHGESSRIGEFPGDYYAQCADIFIDWVRNEKIPSLNLIGVRGGAIIAMAMAIKAPDLVSKLVADSFPGQKISMGNLDLMIKETRKLEKKFLNRVYFRRIHGKDWKKVITSEIQFIESMKYSNHRKVLPALDGISAEILLTGVSSDNLVPNLRPLYKKMIKKNPKIQQKIFKAKYQPSIISSKKEFQKAVLEFLR